MSSLHTEKREHFQQRLRETVAWCVSQNWSYHIQSRYSDWISGKGLRTALLQPPEVTDNMQAIFDAHYPQEKTMELLAIDRKERDQQWQQHVELVAMKRAELLYTQNLISPQIIPPLTGGRILAYNPDMTLSDGASALATQDFFDNEDIPPWDTWLVYVTDDYVRGTDQEYSSYLLSWVPDALVNVVAHGIDMGIEGCILWATDLDTVFIQQLREAGLLC
jgi:hypothetical protein